MFHSILWDVWHVGSATAWAEWKLYLWTSVYQAIVQDYQYKDQSEMWSQITSHSFFSSNTSIEVQISERESYLPWNTQRYGTPGCWDFIDVGEHSLQLWPGVTLDQPTGSGCNVVIHFLRKPYLMGLSTVIFLLSTHFELEPLVCT